ncbi:MAG: AraC family transcriptional regulator [Bacteroidales bacterium]|nr:AraC family transcriptional regulator [Bacteroidales bacterium]
MKLYIKNMVCNRCKSIIRSELEKMGIHSPIVEMGLVTTRKNLSASQRKVFSDTLQKNGFELIDSQKYEVIENLKKAILELENHSDEDLKMSFSDSISLIVKDNFISLNTLFAEIEGITIEKFVIRHKIERVKEMLVYDHYSLAEIANKMHYSNVTQLSAQFKSHTGLSPNHFLQLRRDSVKLN